MIADAHLTSPALNPICCIIHFNVHFPLLVNCLNTESNQSKEFSYHCYHSFSRTKYKNFQSGRNITFKQDLYEHRNSGYQIPHVLGVRASPPFLPDTDPLPPHLPPVKSWFGEVWETCHQHSETENKRTTFKNWLWPRKRNHEQVWLLSKINTKISNEKIELDGIWTHGLVHPRKIFEVSCAERLKAGQTKHNYRQLRDARARGRRTEKSS